LLDLVEKPLNQVSRTVEIRVKQIASLRFRFGGMFGHAPCSLASALIQSASSPIRQQHCFVQENRAKPIVVRLTGREAELQWKTICVHDGMNLGGQPTLLGIVVSLALSVLAVAWLLLQGVGVENMSHLDL
jgi:hypothetical protein